MTRPEFIALLCLTLAGCANPSGNMRVGSEQFALNLQSQRDAVRLVSVAEAVPHNATAMGPIDASRCHRYQGDIEPTPEILTDDLKVAAFARGADGIAGIEVVKESGLLRNCWYIYTARATMYRTTR